MRFFRSGGRILCAAILTLGVVGCIVRESPESDAPDGEGGVKVEIKTGDRDISPGEEGAFEKLGARLDRGAERLDKQLEKGAGKLGEAMQKSGARLQEKSEEAQRRRAQEEAAEGVEVEVNVDRP
jgi:hypothetical protein